MTHNNLFQPFFLIMLLCIHAELTLDECGKSLTTCCTTNQALCIQYCTGENKYVCWSKLAERCSRSLVEMSECVANLHTYPGLVNAVIESCDNDSAPCIDLCVQYPNFCISLCEGEPDICKNIVKNHPNEIGTVCENDPEKCIGLCERREDICIEFCVKNSGTCLDFCTQNLGNCTQHVQDFCDINPVLCIDVCNDHPHICENFINESNFCDTIAGACSTSCDVGSIACTLNFLYNNYAVEGAIVDVIKQVSLDQNINVDFATVTLKGLPDPPKRVLIELHTINYRATQAGTFTLENLQLIRTTLVQDSMLVVGGSSAVTSATLKLFNVHVQYGYEVGQAGLSPISIQTAGFNITNTIFYKGSELLPVSTTKRMANTDDCVLPPINPAVQLVESIGTFSTVTFENFESGTLKVNGGQVTFDGVSFRRNMLSIFEAGYINMRHNAYFQNNSTRVMIKGQGITSDVQTGEAPGIPNLFFSVSPADEVGFFDGLGGILKSTEYSLLYAASIMKGKVEGEGNLRRITFEGDFVPCTYTVGVYRPRQATGTLPTHVPLQVTSNVSASIDFSTNNFPEDGNYTFDLHYKVGGGSNAWTWTSVPVLPVTVTTTPGNSNSNSSDGNGNNNKLSTPLLLVVIIVPVVVFIVAVVVIIIVILYFKRKNQSDPVNVPNFDIHDEDTDGTRAAGTAAAAAGGTTTSRVAGKADLRESKRESSSSPSRSGSRDSCDSSLGESDQHSRSTRSRGSPKGSTQQRGQMRRNDMYAGNSIEDTRPHPFEVGSDNFNPVQEEGTKDHYRDVDDHDSFSDD